MKPSATCKGLFALVLAGLVLRVAAVLILRAYDDPFTYEHGEIARNLLEGRGFTVKFLGTEGPTSQQAPLYPALLAAAYGFWGTGTQAAHLSVQLLQCLAGAAVAPCLAWLSWSLLPQRRSVGWLAGGIAAVHPVHVYMVTHLQVVVWATLLLTWTVALAVAPGPQGRARHAALLGLSVGLLLLVEPILALVTPLLALAFWRRDLAGRRSPWWAWGPAARTVLMASVAALTVAPWLWRNYQVHGEPVFVKSSFGYALWQGNNPHSHGTDKVPKPTAAGIDAPQGASLAERNRALWAARHETLYIDDVVLKPSGYREFAGLTEPQRSQLLKRRAVAFICAHPSRYAELCLARLRYFLLFDETNPKAAHPLYRAATLSWLAAAVLGMCVAGGMRRALWPTWSIFAVTAAFHVLTIVSARFRVPVEPLSFCWCALALAWAGSRTRAALGGGTFSRAFATAVRWRRRWLRV